MLKYLISADGSQAHGSQSGGGGGGDPDEFTGARKRSRRVCFAETTAVHVFARDEEFETPPDSKPSGEGSRPGSEEELGFRGEHLDSDDSKGSACEEDEEEVEDDDGEQERFIMDMDSSSPGSAVGSVTSNDEDNFFGPVSTSFIKSGRLSEAEMSDDNYHDITLDSTAFSLHFQNVVPPDDRSANSASSLRTPTGDSMSPDFDGFVVVSKEFKQQVPQTQLFDGKMSASAGDLSNMSLIVENPDSYDRYGKMSPPLVALLAEANKSMQPSSPFSGSGTRTSQHDTHVSVGVKQSAKDELPICRMDATGVSDDACFDSNLSEGRPKGTCTERNVSGITSNKLAGLSVDALMNDDTQFLAEGIIQRPNNTMDDDKNTLTSVSPKESLLSKPTQDPILHDNDLNCHNLQSAEEPHSLQPGLAGKKRGINQILFTDKDYVSEVSRTQKSPKISPDVAGSNSVVFPGHDVERSKEPVDIGGQAPPKHWTDILTKVSEATKQLFQPSICKLNSVQLENLENTLGDLQTAKKYERLYTSLKNHSCLGEQQKRVAEARSLLDKLTYQKAKLQLKQLKRDELYNKGLLCKSKIQECAKLKSNYLQFCVLDARTVRHRESEHSSNSNKSCTRDQAELDQVTSMRQELEMLDQKVKCMMKVFETSCMMKGNTSCDEIIKVATDHMETRNHCRLIQQDLQLWKLSGIVKENDQCDVVLNYCNILSQRFTIYSRSVTSIVAYNFLNNECIEKNFPNMKACIAFEFVFKVKGACRIANLKQLSQETLETNLLLGTLLDVLEEILVSRVQSWNLISSIFHLQCSGQIDLQLSFLSFKSGRKVTLCLDVSFLNCAAYPSKPSDLQIGIIEAQTTLPPLIFDKIKGVVESLESGRSMIVRLCKSISKVVWNSHES